MPSECVTLSEEQLRDVELALAGAWRSRVTLRIAQTHEAEIKLVDAEGTPVARLTISSIEPDDVSASAPDVIGAGQVPPAPAMARVTGVVSALKPLGHRNEVGRRPTANSHRFASAVLITGDVPGTDAPDWAAIPAGAAVIVLDRGDSRALVAAVANAEAVGRRVVVLPEPSRRNSQREWNDALVAAARHLVSNDITVWSTPRAPSTGRVILLTGLSGSGKSTIAKLLVERLAEIDERTATLLDGDEVRLMLSTGLGFSYEDRILNVQRIGWVAALIAKHGGIAVCAPIAPYAVMRDEMRARAEAVGRFLLVHIATPLEVCEQRDRKGLYAKARAGAVENFTGISDPYEVPTNADLVIDASSLAPAQAVVRIVESLRALDRRTETRPLR